MLWKVEIRPAAKEPNRAGERLAHEAEDLGLAQGLQVTAAHGYLIQGNLNHEQAQRLARELLVDGVVEAVRVAAPDEALWNEPPSEKHRHQVHVLPKPGVMDPVAQSTLAAIIASGFSAEAVRTFRSYWLSDVHAETLSKLCAKLLANDAIEQAIIGPLTIDHLDVSTDYKFKLQHIAIRELDDAALMHLSKSGQLYLQLAEMQTIRDYYRKLDRDPTDAELETLAQTWSEHCSHKTLAGRVHYRGPEGERTFKNMLKETIFAATVAIRKQWGERDWCVSVFKDNAGVITFDETNHVVFKVETHNHPSALEPYGGANTGLGGVIRDPMGTGLGAKPICSTDVFCFARPDYPADQLPAGVLHPRRVMRGVVSGVRDYGNRMGIPTVNGAICFDDRFLGNPLVYCGNVGLIPVDKVEKEAKPGDYIVAVGGRTGRDGIHGATFSSAELTTESETLSGGAVQIGNAITEKMVLDVIMQARDKNLFHAITDCGAGGFSSAVGEMGAELGAQVWLERAPLKYAGLSYTEIWISEAQERMVLAVEPAKWEEFHALCAAEGVEATVLGSFVPTGRLELFYHGERVADLDMHFLHEGRPPVVRPATYTPQPDSAVNWPASIPSGNELLKKVLSDLNVASKEWVIRQYDHEVQAGSVIKPLVGVHSDGPSDAAVVKPVLTSQRGIVLGCGITPSYGDYDTYHMAASAIDEAIRNCVAVGADPAKIAILDNFCWGDCEKPETLGALVRSALACHDVAIALETPFISGKDSLNNEFRITDDSGNKQSIAIPHTLLISAIGQVADVRTCVTMDFKKPGHQLYLVGNTNDELGGSRLSAVLNTCGGSVPRVDTALAKKTFNAMHRAIQSGMVASCHDLSDGGLAVALAECAFAGGIGAMVKLSALPGNAARTGQPLTLLFSESNTRFLVEVAPEHTSAFEQQLAGIPLTALGTTTAEPRLIVEVAGEAARVIDASLEELKAAWQVPLNW
jgi:phosphoribosylformylglycinamidine synthase subunit PurSL